MTKIATELGPLSSTEEAMFLGLNQQIKYFNFRLYLSKK